MPTVSVVVEFILDRKKRLKQLTTLIQDSAFSAVVSLAPLGLGAVQTISGLAAKVLDTFIQERDRKPILEFRGDFNLRDEGEGGLQDGFYVLMGSRDAPLPDFTSLELRDTGLYANGKAVDNVSYVVFEVYVTPYRDYRGSVGAPWREKLDELDEMARSTVLDPYVTSAQRKDVYRECLKGVREANVLLGRDAMYTRREAKKIIERECQSLVETLGVGQGKLGAPFGIDSEVREITGVVDAAELRQDVAEYESALDKLRPELTDRDLVPPFGVATGGS
jgi:hypothetical protein